MRLNQTFALACVSVVAISSPALAQSAASSALAASSGTGVTDIIVTARRKSEKLEDVPKSIAAVTSAELNKLGIRRFEDVAVIVPGLSLDAGNGYAQLTTLRGISFDVNSGQDAATDFYLNDSSIQQTYLFRSLYDISQIEVEKGPQGTLRGRSTPSGSISFTTTQPNLYKFGGYVDGTLEGSKIADNNLNGAINVPIIKGVLAVRVAGSLDDSNGTDVKPAGVPGQSSTLTANPYDRNWSERISVRFEPTDTLQFNVMYQHMVERFLSYPQTASNCTLPNATVTCAAGFPIITAQQRLSTVNGTTMFDEMFDIVQGSAKWHFLGQTLNYVGSYSVGTFDNAAPDDGAAVLGPFGPFTVTGTHSRNVYQSHEIRLASDRRIANIFDYTAGFFTLDTPTDNTVTYPGGNPVIIANGDRKESSIYGNVTAHFTSKLEVSGGIRKILKSSNQSLTEVLPNTVLGNAYLQYKPTIWTASVSYHFTPAFMAYINAGTSFRQGTDSVGPVSTPGGYSIYSVDPGGVAGELNYVNLQPEYSHSYEVGLKSQFHEKRGTFNFDYFHQTFSNFLYANANNVNVNGYGTTLPPPPTTPLATWLASFKYDPVGSAPSSGFGSNVPVTVDGVEADASYIFSPNFNLAASASYVRSKITGGTIACNSTDIGAKALLDANGLPSIYACPGNGPASFVSPFGMTVQGEYSHQLDDAVMGYVRGLVDFKGATLYNPGDPANQQKAYALINIYAGIRNVRKGWDVNFFVKNLANTQVMLAAYGGNNPESSITGAVSPAYSTVAVAPPRQFGINLRYEFGSK